MAGQTFTPTRSPAMPLGVRILHLEAENDLRVAQYINDGLLPSVLEHLAEHLRMSVSDLLALAGIKSSTYFERKRRRRPLSPEESSRVYRLAKVVEATEAYFEGDREAARRWLLNKKMALGGEAPLEFARTPEGSDYLIRLLGRMAHGIPS